MSEQTKKAAGKKATEKKSSSGRPTKALPQAKFPYAVVQTGSKQYKVSEGDMILVEKLEVEPGAKYSASEVLFVAKAPGSFQIGKPLVSGASVEFEVLQQTLDRKVLIRHHRRRQNSQKTLGHRQPQTRLLVKSINA